MRKSFFALLSGLLCFVSAGGAEEQSSFQPDPAKLDIYMPYLKRIPLSGWWKVKKVSDDRTNNWNDIGQTSKFYEAGFDDSAWTRDLEPNDIHIPFLTKFPATAGWNEMIQAIPKEVREWGGVVYFRKDFSAPAMAKDERAILSFDGVAGAFTVYVNGKRISEEQPYVPPTDYRGPQQKFEFDATSAIKPNANNNVTVRLFHNGHPLRWSWAGRAGLVDRIYVDIRPAAYTSNVLATPQKDLKSVLFDCVLSGSKETADVSGWTGEIFDWNGGKTVARFDFGKVHEEDSLRMISGRGEIENAKLWSWQSPFLYGVRVKNSRGEVAGVQRFGMRTFEAKDGAFLLNGKPVMLRGMCMGFEMPLGIGWFFAFHTNYDGAFSKYLGMFARANVNHWRMHSSIASRACYEVADELGIIMTDELGYDEARIKNPERADMIDVKGFDGACDKRGALLPEFESYVKARIRNAYSHPCVCTYSFGNEIRQYDDPRVEKLLNSLYDLYHKIDKQGRPATNSSGRFWKDATNVEELSKREKLDYIDTHDYTGSINNFPISFCEPVILHFSEAVKKSYGEKAPPVVNGETVYMGNHYYGNIFDGIWKSESDPQPDWNKMLYMLDKWAKDSPDQSFLSYYWVRNWGSKNYKYERPVGRGIYLERIVEAQRKTWPLQDGYEILCGPYFSNSNAYPFDQIKFTPNASYRSLTQVNAPLVAVLDFVMPNRFSNEAISTRAHIVNNFENAVDDISFEAAIERDGKTLVSKAMPVGRLESGEKRILPLELTMPQPPGDYKLVYRVRSNGKLFNERELPLNGRSRAEVFGKIPTAKRIALYDASSVFGGLKPRETFDLLKAFGLEFKEIPSFDNLMDFYLLIIASDSIDGRVQKGATSIRSFVENGGRLLVFEQNFTGRIPFLPELQYVLAGPGQFSEMLQADHPACKGLSQENFFCWNQKDWSVYHTYVYPVSRAALSIGGDTSQWGSDHFGMVSAHLKVGKGDVLLCQAEASFCGQRDSGAGLFARRLLETSLDDETRKYASEFVGLPAPKAKPVAERDALFVSLKDAANMAFADDVAKDGKGGWTDQGALNDLSTFPLGKRAFNGVPFEIIDPASNGNRSCVVISENQDLKFQAKAKPIAVGAKLKRLLFLHSGAWMDSSKKERVGQYEIVYESGEKAVVPIVSGVNIGDWWGTATAANFSEADCAWSGMNKSGVVGVYIFEWKNARPDESIREIRFGAQGKAVIGLVGVTGEKNK